MTNNMDEFEQDEMGMEAEGPAPKKSFVEAWRSRPLFKLIVIMVFAGGMIAAALGAFSSPPAPDSTKLVNAPNLNVPPGGQASSYFVEQNKQANAQRAEQAMQQGGSALPTPVGQTNDIGDLTNKDKKDPLMEFRAETDRLRQEIKQEQQKNAQQIQVLQNQVVQREPEDDTLARAMQKQMQQLMEGWSPHNMKLVAGTEKEVPAPSAPVNPSDDAAALSRAKKPKTIIAAGTVNYGQLLVEANSDVPGPVLAQIMSGPLAGGRAIGRFQVMNDYLVIQFSLVSLKGKDYPVSAIALDPNTTLGGMATEVDHRYFDRLVLPSAASFLSSFGQTMGEGRTTSTVTGDFVVVDQAKKGVKDAVYDGIGKMGETAGQFFQNRANQIKTLVRVAVGTPMGIFFLSPVVERTTEEGELQNGLTAQQMELLRRSQLGSTLAAGYNAGLAGAQVVPGVLDATVPVSPTSQQGLLYPNAAVPTSNSTNVGYYGGTNRATNGPVSIYGGTSIYGR